MYFWLVSLVDLPRKTFTRHGRLLHEFMITYVLNVKHVKLGLKKPLRIGMNIILK